MKIDIKKRISAILIIFLCIFDTFPYSKKDLLKNTIFGIRIGGVSAGYYVYQDYKNRIYDTNIQNLDFLEKHIDYNNNIESLKKEISNSNQNLENIKIYNIDIKKTIKSKNQQKSNLENQLNKLEKIYTKKLDELKSF